MQFASIVLAAGIGIGCCTANLNAIAGASAPGDAHWVEAQSLRELPAGIQVLLGVGLAPDEGGIADRGARFNATDIMIDGVPDRRFALGAVNGDTALVAVERGGRGYSVRTLEFKQVGATWAAVRCVSTSTVPHYRDELVDAVAHPVQNQPACNLAAELAGQPTASR